MSDFDEIISFENLYRAHRRARLGKRHKKEVVLFEAALSENLWALHYDLKYNKYIVGEYHKFMIHDPKDREIQAISYRDRIVQHVLCDNYLMPLLNRHLIYDNAACRKEKGTSFAIARFRKFMCEHYKRHGNSGYLVKIDVSKYFPSIEHNVLKNMLVDIVKNDRILHLLYQIIDSYGGESERGLPMGNQSSQCFALLYLNAFDKYFKEQLQVKHYIRYMDDILMIVLEKPFAKKCFIAAERLLTEVKLTINPKSQIIPMRNGINFIGWNFKFSPSGKLVQKVCASSKRYILARVKAARCGAQKREMVCASYQGYLGQGDNYHFEKRINDILMARTLSV